jgi:hypothetical protein
MITFTKAYKTSDNETFDTIEGAQAHELENLFDEAANGTLKPEELISLSTTVMNCKEKVIDILTMKPTSKPRARKANGGSKTRKAADPVPQPTPAQA